MSERLQVPLFRSDSAGILEDEVLEASHPSVESEDLTDDSSSPLRAWRLPFQAIGKVPENRGRPGFACMVQQFRQAKQQREQPVAS